ncbi:MAG: hypothetical protein ACRDFX_12390, partial [Chloroflexota bacterium]
NQAIVIADQNVLEAGSYTPDKHLSVDLASGARLYVFHSVCTGSADGKCQAIDVFKGGSPTVIWHRQFAQVLALTPAYHGFRVKSERYRPQDPLCCPSLPPVTTVYTWNGNALTARRLSAGSSS